MYSQQQEKINKCTNSMQVLIKYLKLIDGCTHQNVGGVLWRELSLSITVKSNTKGHVGNGLPSRSLRTITTTTPEGPMFFCAPANTTPNCNR